MYFPNFRMDMDKSMIIYLLEILSPKIYVFEFMERLRDFLRNVTVIRKPPRIVHFFVKIAKHFKMSINKEQREFKQFSL